MIRKENGQKRSSECFLVLSAKFTANLDCETSVCDIMAGYNLTRDKSSSLAQISTGLCHLQPSPFLRYDLNYCSHV